jgi:hypothetical protein
MEPSELRRAVDAGAAAASALGLGVNGVDVVHNSNRIVVRLKPSDVLARVAPQGHRSSAQFEIEIARRLTETNSPIAGLESRVEPRVYVRDDFVVTFWNYYVRGAASGITPPDYARALGRLHAGFRQIEAEAPHFTDRVAHALGVVADRERSPELLEPDRELLGHTLTSLGTAISARSGGDQLLHGEPHPGNVLNTRSGPLFVDLETCCRGPVEFDLAHAPDRVGQLYPEADQGLLDLCRILMRAMVTAWRWDREDQFPNRRHWRIEGLNQLRSALDR